MFDNVGSKIKAVAKVFAWLGIVGFGILGLIVMFANGDTPVPGLLIIIAGCLGSWISSLSLYGLGQLIENTDKLVEINSPKTASSLNDIESNLPKI